MSVNLISEIEAFLEEFGIGEHRFGVLAARNGRLVERLRSGGRIWPETEDRVREYMADRRRQRTDAEKRRKSKTAEAAA